MIKCLIFGPALIPDLKIYRKPNNKVQKPHYIMFSAETIEKIRRKFHKKNYNNRVNINHSGILISGVTMTKSFLLNPINRGSVPNEFQNLPNGTWMIEYIVENDYIWKQIQEKNLNGFSIEGLIQYIDTIEK